MLERDENAFMEYLDRMLSVSIKSILYQQYVKRGQNQFHGWQLSLLRIENDVRTRRKKSPLYYQAVNFIAIKLVSYTSRVLYSSKH